MQGKNGLKMAYEVGEDRSSKAHVVIEQKEVSSCQTPWSYKCTSEICLGMWEERVEVGLGKDQRLCFVS